MTTDQPTKDDERRFSETLRAMADQAQREVGYKPTRFRQMLAQRGAFGTAHHLLGRKEISDGFTSLQIANRVDLTLECVAQRPEWRRFFTPEELSHAHQLTGPQCCS